MVSYKIFAGDNLTKIARKKFKTSIELIRYLNKKKDDKIMPGKSLKVIDGMPTVEIYKDSFFLVVYLAQGLYLESYEIGLGKEDKTPVGTFVIKTKEEKPLWYAEENGKTVKIPYGDPRHAIGSRWMGFDFEGIGIHGTKEPQSIGKNQSSGCIRMLNEEVEKLYDLLAMGTQVVIKK